jgi:hypothetical protein
VADKGKDDEAGKGAAAATGSVDLTRAAGVTSTHVVLQAQVVPSVAGLGATFEYGPTTAYGFTAAASPAALPRSGATASATIDGLTPSTTYHFRVVVGTGPLALTARTPRSRPPRRRLRGRRQGSGDGDHGNDDKGQAGKGRSESAKKLEPVQVTKPPVLGESVAVGPRAGSVKVRSADGKSFTLTAGATIPAGSVIDATKGTVAMTSALDGEGAVQTAEFSGGRFQVRQSADGDGVVDIYLKGSIGRCRANTARLASTSSTKRPGRRLWGRDRNGRFRTHGNDSVASVRGTRWLTEDTCAGHAHARHRGQRRPCATCTASARCSCAPGIRTWPAARADPALLPCSGMADDLPIHVDDVPSHRWDYGEVGATRWRLGRATGAKRLGVRADRDRPGQALRRRRTATPTRTRGPRPGWQRAELPTLPGTATSARTRSASTT